MISQHAAFAAAAEHHRAGELQAAEHLYRQILAADPGHAESLHLLGVLAHQSGRHAEAVALITQAIGRRGDDPYYHANLADALRAIGRLDAAVAQFRRALLLKPDLAAAYSGLGCALLDQGAIEPAQRAQEYAIALEPRNPLYCRRLLQTRRVTPADSCLAEMQALARDAAALSPADQIELHFALGKAYADLRQPHQAFPHYRQGNALKRREIPYDEAAMLGFFDRVRAAFPAELLQQRHGCGDPSDTPVFIVGMPRAGTTLVEQILASHPRVAAGGELDLFPQAAVSLRSQHRPDLAFPEIMPALGSEALRQLGAQYREALATIAPGAERCTDKLPANSFFVGLIVLALPNARIIHVRRNPIDTLFSCFTTLFESGHPFSYDLAELGRYYRAHARLMAHWRDVLPPAAMLEVAYEDVVADIAAEARRMIAWCGLAWDDACLAFHRTQRPVSTASAFQVRQPIYRSSVDRSRGYRDFLAPLLRELAAAA